MNKADLISAVSTKSGVSKNTAEEVLGSLTQLISETVADGGEIKIPGFGSFKMRTRAARTGRNPKTGETMNISASKNVVFKPAKALKDQVS